MSAHTCCNVKTGTRDWTLRCAQFAGWAAPGAVLAFMPKCPACLAAYIAVGTGLGLSFESAALVRTLLMGACVTALVSLATLRLRRYWGQ